MVKTRLPEFCPGTGHASRRAHTTEWEGDQQVPVCKDHANPLYNEYLAERMDEHRSNG